MMVLTGILLIDCSSCGHSSMMMVASSIVGATGIICRALHIVSMGMGMMWG